MMKAVLFTLLTFYVELAAGQVNILDNYMLPAALTVNAHSIKREEKIDFEVRSIGEARMTVHQVLTAFDIAGMKDLFFEEFSYQFRTLDEVEIKVFNSAGVLQKKYKKKDLNAESLSEGLVEDGKVYFLSISSPSFPVTVQYDYEIQYSGTLNYPNFDIQSPGQSVQHSSYTARVPIALDLRFKPRNIKLEPVVNNEGSNKIYKWEVKDLATLPVEEGVAGSGDGYPQILIAPNKFEMDGYPGELTSWRSFGDWLNNLYRDGANLSEERKQFFQNLVKNAPDSREKARLIYKYLQANFRYVSIQLGIGGYKPFSADFVDNKKYGDCKALSNYAMTCLRAVGIKSYPAIINAEYNQEPVDASFPHNGFNHVILCVPNGKDTIWLECTSTTNEFGVLGSFTENRNALLLTENGGVLVSTPISTPGENTLSINTAVKLTDDGSGETSSLIRASGEYRDDMIRYLKNAKKDDQKTFLVNHLGFPQPDDYELNSGDFNSETALKLKLEKVPAFTAGSKMFLNPRIYKIWSYPLPQDEKRKHDFYFHSTFLKTDTTVYYLPEGFTAETLPKPRFLKFEFGSFKTTFHFDEAQKTITSYATLILTRNKIPPEKYDEARKFFNDVLEEFTDKIVVRKL